jgi:CheY-like chemotaxis protein
MLEGAGAQVRAVATVALAMTAFGKFHPQVLLTDLAMPVEDGFSLISKVRAHREGRHLPLIALSARAGDEDRRRSLASGFQLHLVKPVDADHLAQAIVRVTQPAPGNEAAAATPD